MKASQLRDLSRKYASGGIKREDYLAARRRLIDAITKGEEKLAYRELDPAQAGGNAVARRPSRTLFAAIGLVLVLVIAFAAHFLSGNGNDSASVGADVRSSPVEQAPENRAVSLLERFSDRDDWSHEALTELEAEWARQSPEVQKAARDSVAFRRLSREVQARIREHEALMAAGGESDALMRAARLRSFAEALGIST